MLKTPAKEGRRPACTLILKRFLQVSYILQTPLQLLKVCTRSVSDVQAPILDFGVVKFGSCRSLDCQIKNLDQQEQQVPLPV